MSDRGGALRFLTLPAVLLVVAILLGGGGAPAPVTAAVVQGVALILLGVAVVAGRTSPVDRGWACAFAAILVFPIAQLLPLPPALWRVLPRHEPAAAALDGAGLGLVWQPWSLVPDGGVAALCALVPALVMAWLIGRMPLATRVRLIVVLVGIGGVAALFGLLQFMRGEGRPLSLYPYSHRGFAIGFFANRNAQADLIAITLIAAVLLIDRHRERFATRPAQVLAAAGLAVILAGGVATGSRMGVAMLGVPLVLAVTLAGRRSRLPVLALAAAAAGVLTVGGSALDRVVGRAHDPGNRVEIWADSLFVAREVAPLGAGMGSFVPLYTAAEPLDLVQPTYANRAHNDYLELAIEGGVPSLAVLAGVIVFAVRRSARGWHNLDRDGRLLARFAGLTLLVLAVHSLVDYPLRTEAMLSVAGLAFGSLAMAPRLTHKAWGARIDAEQQLGRR